MQRYWTNARKKLDAQIEYIGQGIMKHQWELFIFKETQDKMGSKGPHSATKKCAKRWHMLCIKRDPVPTSRSRLKCNAWPKTKNIPRTSWECWFLCFKINLGFPLYIPCQTEGTNERKKKTKWCWVCSSLRGIWQRNLQTPKLTASVVHRSPQNSPRDLWEFKPRPWVLGDSSYHALTPKHAHKVANTTPRRKRR